MRTLKQWLLIISSVMLIGVTVQFFVVAIGAVNEGLFLSSINPEKYNTSIY